jgi:hypothetical protein
MPPKDRKLEQLIRFVETDCKIITAQDLAGWTEIEIEEYEKKKILLFRGFSDEIRCNQCHKNCPITVKIVEYPDGQKKGVGICPDKENGGRLEFELSELKYWEINKAKLIELGYYEEPKEDTITSEAAPIYTEINAAERTVTVGADECRISSEKIWDFFTTLIGNKKKGRHTPRSDGLNNWKNAVDTLRRQIGKDNLKQLLHFAGDGYYLRPSVKIKYHSQVAIRKTKQKKMNQQIG